MNNNIKKRLRCLKTMMNIWYAGFSITFLVHQQFHQHYSPVINRNILAVSKQIRLLSHLISICHSLYGDQCQACVLRKL